MQNSQKQLRRLNFRCALVIVATDHLRMFIVELLRKQGWLVHGIRQTEQAFKLLAHIPYELVVIDSEVAETSGTDNVRSLQNAREWPTVKLVFITNSQSTGCAGEITDRGAFLARESKWKDDLCRFLSAYDEA
jgi:DNA-binding response OmpR family regulator